MARWRRVDRVALPALLLAIVWVPQAAARTSTTRLARYASAVVLATVVERALAVQPELEPATRLPLAPDGTGFGPDANIPIIGELVRIRIDEVLKPDGMLSVGGLVDVFVTGFLATGGQWLGIVDRQYVLYLQLPLSSAEQRRSTADIVQRYGGSGPVQLVDLESVYRVVDSSAGGAVLASSVRLPALRDTIAAAIRPTVAITKPGPLAALAGSVTLAADAHDDGGVASVQFKVDGAAVGPAIKTRPFEHAWFSKSVPNGTHSLVAVARDGHGHETMSAPVEFATVNTNVGPSVGGGTTWNATGWNCRSAQAVKTDPDGDPLVCEWHVGRAAAASAGPTAEAVGQVTTRVPDRTTPQHPRSHARSRSPAPTRGASPTPSPGR